MYLVYEKLLDGIQETIPTAGFEPTTSSLIWIGLDCCLGLSRPVVYALYQLSYVGVFVAAWIRTKIFLLSEEFVCWFAV